jgi:hypothetical protein
MIASELSKELSANLDAGRSQKGEGNCHQSFKRLSFFCLIENYCKFDDCR